MTWLKRTLPLWLVGLLLTGVWLSSSLGQMSVSGPLSMPAGATNCSTVGLPFASDTDTGFSSGGANIVAVCTNGAVAATFNALGGLTAVGSDPYTTQTLNLAGVRTLISGDNTNTGTTGLIQGIWQNSLGTLYLTMYGSGYTSSGIATANGGALRTDTAGGLSVGATHASGTLRLFANNVEGVRLDLGHIQSLGTAPGTLTAGCGSTASIAGTDVMGTITLGGTGITAVCGFTFANTWTNIPKCTADDVGASVAAAYGIQSVETTTTATFNKSPSATVFVGPIRYSCLGRV